MKIQGGKEHCPGLPISHIDRGRHSKMLCHKAETAIK